jgi:hypothetical protein
MFARLLAVRLSRSDCALSAERDVEGAERAHQREPVSAVRSVLMRAANIRLFDAGPRSR